MISDEISGCRHIFNGQSINIHIQTYIFDIYIHFAALSHQQINHANGHDQEKEGHARKRLLNNTRNQINLEFKIYKPERENEKKKQQKLSIYPNTNAPVTRINEMQYIQL